MVIIKPVYHKGKEEYAHYNGDYATLHFLRDEYPTEYLRMGPELKETIDDVLAEVEQMAIDYA